MLLSKNIFKIKINSGKNNCKFFLKMLYLSIENEDPLLVIRYPVIGRRRICHGEGIGVGGKK